MKKYYFLIPEAEKIRDLINDLRGVGLTAQSIGILAHHDTELDTKLEVSELTDENLSDFGELGKSDLLPALEKGAAMGGSVGLVGSLLAMAFPPAGLVVGGGAVLAFTAVGAGLGAWISSLIGISAPHQDIEKYVDAIQKGGVLLLVDSEDEQAEQVKDVVQQYYPEVEMKEAGNFIPAAS